MIKMLCVRGYWLENYFLFFLGLPGGSVGKESACNARGLGLIPGLGLILGLGRSVGEETGLPLQCSGLENSVDCVCMGLQRVEHDWANFSHSLLFFLVLHSLWSIKIRYSLMTGFYSIECEWKRCVLPPNLAIKTSHVLCSIYFSIGFYNMLHTYSVEYYILCFMK